MEPNRSFGSPMGGGSMPNISLPDAGLAPRADPTTPLMGGAAGLGAGMGQGLGAGLSAPTGSPDIRSSSMTGTEPSQPSQPSQPETYVYKAKALYSYTAAADDPNELSFAKGEILDIVDKQGKWWQAKSASGRRGIAPSNYLQII
jgi:SHO1 osmosensor